MKKQGFFYSSVILIASAVITKIIGAIFRIPLSNMLGGTGIGYFSSAYGIFMTVYAAAVTGLPVAVAKLTAESCALERYGNLRCIKRTSLMFFSAAGLFFTVLMLFLARPFVMSVSGNPLALPAVAAIAPSVFFCCVTAVYRGYSEGMRNMYPTALSQVAEALVKLCAGLAVCGRVLETDPQQLSAVMRLFFGSADYSGEEAVRAVAAAGAALGVTASCAAGMLFMLVNDMLFGRKKYPPSSCTADESGKILRNILTTAVPVAIGALITNLTSLIDLVTIIRMLSSAVQRAPEYFRRFITEETELSLLPDFMFGSFTGLAVTVFNLIPSFTNMFGKGVLPSLAEAFAAGKKELVQRSVENVIFVTAFVSAPAGFGIAAISECILKLLFPLRAAEAAVCTDALRILGASVALLAVSSSLFSVLQAAGRSRVTVKIMLAGAAVKLVGNIAFVGVPKLNVSGAALSTLLCYALIFFLSVGAVGKYTKADMSRVKTMLAKIFFCSLLCAGGALLAKNIMENITNNIITTAFSVLSGFIIYIISTHLTGIFSKSTLKMLI